MNSNVVFQSLVAVGACHVICDSPLLSYDILGCPAGDAPGGRALQRGCLVANCVSFLGVLWGAPALVGGGQETPGVVPLTQVSDLDL